VDEAQVLRFWRAAPFDLGLKSYEGNCDLCFLKSRFKLTRIIRENLGISDWWEAMEAECGSTFRPPERVQSYRDLRRFVETQDELTAFTQFASAGREIMDDRTGCEIGCTD
jgi:hypothetical protein